MYVSASQGHHEAQFELAALLHLGMGVEKNNEQSFIWAKKSAEAGNKKAERFLAHCYQIGIGVRPDAAQAKSWTVKASNKDPEPELPQTGEQALSSLIHIVLTTICANPTAGHEGRVGTYVSRGMSEGQAEQSARQGESETASMCRALQRPSALP